MMGFFARTCSKQPECDGPDVRELFLELRRDELRGEYKSNHEESLHFKAYARDTHYYFKNIDNYGIQHEKEADDYADPVFVME